MTKNTVIKSTVMIMVISVLSRFLGLIRETLIASKFGASYSTDIYMFSTEIVTVLFTFVGTGIATTFIPMLTEYIEKKGYRERNNFINNIINVTSIFTFGIMILQIIFAYYFVYFFAPGFRENLETFNTATNVTKILTLSLIFIALQNIFSGIHQSHNEFFVPAAMSLYLNLIFIVYLIFFADRYGILGFAVANVIAYFVQYIVHIPKYKKLGYKYERFIDLKDPGLRKMLILMLPIIVGTSISKINFIIDKLLATKLGEGAISVLGFADKLNTFVYGVFGVAISTVVYPSLSTYSIQENLDGYRNVLIKSINMILLIIIPASVGLIVLRNPVVSIIYQRGEFNQHAASLTATAFLFYSPTMTAYGVRDVLNRAFYSIKDTKTPMYNGIIGVLINIVLNIILSKFMGTAGLALATSISAVTTTVLLIISLNKKLNDIGIKTIAKSFGKIGLAAFLMGVVVAVANNMCLSAFGLTFKGNLISVAVSVIVGAVSYLGLIHVFKVEEYVYALEMVKNRFSGNNSK